MTEHAHKALAQQTHWGHDIDLQFPTLCPVGPKWRVWVGGLWFLRHLAVTAAACGSRAGGDWRQCMPAPAAPHSQSGTGQTDQAVPSPSFPVPFPRVCLSFCLSFHFIMHFPGGPVVKTLRFHCRGLGFDFWSGD